MVIEPFAKTPEYNGEAAMYVGQVLFISNTVPLQYAWRGNSMHKSLNINK